MYVHGIYLPTYLPIFLSIYLLKEYITYINTMTPVQLLSLFVTSLALINFNIFLWILLSTIYSLMCHPPIHTKYSGIPNS